MSLSLSALLHALAYLATPYFVLAWHEPVASPFEAALVPATEAPAVSAVSPTALVAPKQRTARPASPKPSRVARSEAKFAAPENAIAVAPASQSTDLGDSVVAVESGDTNASPAIANTPVAAETKVAAQGTTPIASVPATPVDAAAHATVSPPVELPSRITLAYRMTSGISDGVADYTWTRDGEQYEIDSNMRATGFIVGNLVGVLHQVSRGTVTTKGLRPNSYQIRRGESTPDGAEFLYASNELQLARGNGQVRTVPLSPQLQDMQSFLFQLAYDAPFLRNADDRLDLMVTNARKVYRHRFRRVGVEAVQTKDGPVQTVHLRSEASDPEDVYEVWLAPANYHLPVKLKFFAGRFPVELIATSVRTTP